MAEYAAASGQWDEGGQVDAGVVQRQAGLGLGGGAVPAAVQEPQGVQGLVGGQEVRALRAVLGGDGGVLLGCHAP